MGRWLGLVSLLFALGCTTTLADGDTHVEGVTKAFAATVETHYQQQVLELVGKPIPPAIYSVRAIKGAALIEELQRCGLAVSSRRAALGIGGLYPLVERWLHTRSEWVFAQVGASVAGAQANSFPGSFVIARRAERLANLRLSWSDLSSGPENVDLRFHVVLYDDVVLQPFDVWMAMQGGAAPPVRSHVVKQIAYVPMGPLVQQAHERFVGKAEHYVALTKRYPNSAALRSLEQPERLHIVHELLRWRLWRPVWREVQAEEPAVQARSWARDQGLRLARVAVVFQHAQRLPVADPQLYGLLALCASEQPLDGLVGVVGMAAAGPQSSGAKALERICRQLYPKVLAAEAVTQLPWASEQALRAAATRALGQLR